MKIKEENIKCEIDMLENGYIGLIKDRSNIRGMFRRFLVYKQVGIYELPKKHNFKIDDIVILEGEKIIRKV